MIKLLPIWALALAALCLSRSAAGPRTVMAGEQSPWVGLYALDPRLIREARLPRVLTAVGAIGLSRSVEEASDLLGRIAAATSRDILGTEVVLRLNADGTFLLCAAIPTWLTQPINGVMENSFTLGGTW